MDFEKEMTDTLKLADYHLAQADIAYKKSSEWDHFNKSALHGTLVSFSIAVISTIIDADSFRFASQFMTTACIVISVTCLLRAIFYGRLMDKHHKLIFKIMNDSRKRAEEWARSQKKI